MALRLPAQLDLERPVGAGREAEQLPADAVAAGDKQTIVGQHQDLGDLLGRRPGIAPQNAPVPGVVPDDVVGVENEDLSHAGQLRQHGRAVGGRVVATGPQLLATLPVIGHQGMTVGAAGHHDDCPLEHQGRAADAVRRRAGSVVLQNVDGPDPLAALLIEHVE